MESFIGIDIGGTKISGILLEDEKIINQGLTDTGAHRRMNEILDSLFELISKLMTPDVKAIGIGVPGILDKNQGKILEINNIPDFEGLILSKILEKKFHIPVFIENDANCFAYGESIFGAGKNYTNLIGITLGTGVGGGIIINRKIYSGHLGAAGEFGCLPYADGHFEEYGGNQFFIKYFGKSGKELFNLAEKGNVEAKKAFLEYGKHLANILSSLIYSFSPEAIIIGGSIPRAYKYFELPIRQMLANFSINVIAESVEIHVSSLVKAGELGAAAMAINKVQKRST